MGNEHSEFVWCSTLKLLWCSTQTFLARFHTKLTRIVQGIKLINTILNSMFVCVGLYTKRSFRVCVVQHPKITMVQHPNFSCSVSHQTDQNCSGYQVNQYYIEFYVCVCWFVYETIISSLCGAAP